MRLADPHGRPIIEAPELAGTKAAIRRNGTLYVSPAMMALIRDCQSTDDLFALLSQIPFRVLSASCKLRPITSPKG